MITVVTRHKALVDYLLERGTIQEGNYKVIDHANAGDVAGQDIIGVLPLRLACLAKSVTEVPLYMTPEMRGRELSLEEVREIAGTPTVYTVRKVCEL